MQFAVISFLYFTPYDNITNIFVTLTLHAVAFITQSQLACKKVLNCGIDGINCRRCGINSYRRSGINCRHCGIDDWEIILIDKGRNKQEARKKGLDTFVPPGLNERVVEREWI